MTDSPLTGAEPRTADRVSPGLADWSTSGYPGTGEPQGRQQAGTPEGKPDAGAPSDASPQQVFGPDDRARATNTAKYPERANVLILALAPNETTYPCTGFLYSPNTVATAGHCVHGSDRGGWMTSAQVFPGRDGNATPYGSCYATCFYSVRGWVEDGDRDYDYGAIKLDCSIGDQTGWLGLQGKAGSYNGERVAVVGYPFEKEPLYSMWGQFGNIEGSRTHNLLYTIDTTFEQSGAPAYKPCSDGIGFCAIASHANSDAAHNYGIRFTQAAFNNYQTWRN